jgi:probable RNA-binding protein EIF1AD
MENSLSTKSSSNSDTSSNLQQPQSEESKEESGSDEDEDDGLPPLEANTNRNRPYELYSDNNSDSGSESE